MNFITVLIIRNLSVSISDRLYHKKILVTLILIHTRFLKIIFNMMNLLEEGRMSETFRALKLLIKILSS